ncbi:DUF1622 domain-containing protein [Catalinimonas sp. 4WD22]|uniref:DUF1622 domain-containing protein n=1 Tax=Catalinimonas locisalis TaxID=3133978 RepID=UPI003100B945
MSELVKPIAEWCAAIVEVIGVGILTLTALYICFYSLIKVLSKDKTENTFHKARQRLGRGILMGLELLVAADIIHTVAVDLSFSTVGVLAVIVLIRTFLSFTLELELTGKWPWQNNSEEKQSQNT